MPKTHTARWRSLERWSPTLFLAAGVLFVGHATVRGIEAFTTVPPPVDVFGPLGYVAAILGLFGLYPTLADQSRSISRGAAVLAGVTAPVWLLISGWNFGEAAGLLPPQTDVVPGAFFVAVILSTFAMYLLFGIATLRCERHTRTVGHLLLVPAAMFAVLIVGGVVLSMDSAVGGLVVGAGQALAHGAIGGRLVTGKPHADHPDPSGDVLGDR